MAKAPSLFGSKGIAVPDNIMERFRATTDRIAGGGSDYRRISIRGGRFRKIVRGEQLEVSNEPQMNVVIIDAAEVGRTYHSTGWDAENPSAPTCWSPDGERPSPDVAAEDKQSDRCMNCPMNVKGSGNNNTRACRFSQRLAVAIEGDMDTVYQLQLPAASIFGKPEGKHYPLQAYARLLKEHDNTPINVLVTEMAFDQDSESPKLFFKPVRPLDAEEIAKVSELLDSEEVQKCLNMTVTKNDSVPVETEDDDDEEEAPPPKAKAKPKAKPKPAPVETADEDDDDEEEEPEPPKKKSKPKETVVEDSDDDDDDQLSSLLSQWDD